jgi:hypothetical protein
VTIRNRAGPGCGRSHGGVSTHGSPPSSTTETGVEPSSRRPWPARISRPTCATATMLRATRALGSETEGGDVMVLASLRTAT